MNNNNLKLNHFIYNDIEEYLIYNCNRFKELLNYSLICKSSFLKIQYYLTYKQKEIKFKINLNSFLYYIYNIKRNTVCENDIEYFNQFVLDKSESEFELQISKINKYNFKLIQFKEIQKLYCINQYGKYRMKKFYLKKKCENLNKVIVMDYHRIQTYENDPTKNGFYQFKKLSLSWSEGDWPESYANECGDGDYYEYNYSFQFLERFNTFKKIAITTHISNKMHLEYLDNILLYFNNNNNINYNYSNNNNCNNNNKVQKITFFNHNTPYSFLIKLFNNQYKYSQNLKTLIIRLGNFSINFKSQLEMNDQEIEKLEEQYENEINTSELISNLFNQILESSSNNFKLNKLIINRNEEPFSSPNSNDPSMFLQSLVKYKNQSIKLLGLEVFKINDYQLLKPLIQLPNISTLYCYIDSLDSFLQHCLENKNIKILKAGMDYSRFDRSNKFMDISNLNSIKTNFNNFLNLNQNLEKLYLYGYILPQFIEFIKSLNNLKNLQIIINNKEIINYKI